VNRKSEKQISATKQTDSITFKFTQEAALENIKDHLSEEMIGNLANSNWKIRFGGEIFILNFEA
jgi:hypothetical protein